MNKRIKQLAQAAAKQHGHTIKFSKEISEVLDTLGKMIVLEAAEVSNQHWLQHKGCGAGFSICSHFGVFPEDESNAAQAQPLVKINEKE